MLSTSVTSFGQKNINNLLLLSIQHSVSGNIDHVLWIVVSVMENTVHGTVQGTTVNNYHV